jgi:hypothetical protein
MLMIHKKGGQSRSAVLINAAQSNVGCWYDVSQKLDDLAVLAGFVTE